MRPLSLMVFLILAGCTHPAEQPDDDSSLAADDDDDSSLAADDDDDDDDDDTTLLDDDDDDDDDTSDWPCTLDPVSTSGQQDQCTVSSVAGAGCSEGAFSPVDLSASGLHGAGCPEGTFVMTERYAWEHWLNTCAAQPAVDPLAGFDFDTHSFVMEYVTTWCRSSWGPLWAASCADEIVIDRADLPCPVASDDSVHIWAVAVAACVDDVRVAACTPDSWEAPP